MLAELKQLVTMVEGYHDNIKRMLNEADTEGLNWEPTEDGQSNSIYGGAVHIALVEMLFSRRLGGAEGKAAIPDEAEWGQGDIGLKSRGDTPLRAVELLDGALAGLKEILGELLPEKLDGVSVTRRGEVTNRWMAWHCVDHTAEHWGQMELTRQLYFKRKV